MEKKIKIRIIFIGILSVMLTVVTLTAFFNGVSEKQSRNTVKISSDIIREGYNLLENKQSLSKFDSEYIRITLVTDTGDVLYDSLPDTVDFENHISRPEIQEALNNGEGESVRRSETLGKKMYYYAVKTDDGNVLRIGIETNDIFSSIKNVLPVIIGIIIFMLIISYILSAYMTRKITRPMVSVIENYENVKDEEVYDELKPLIKNMREQQEKKKAIENMKNDFTTNVSHELKTPLTSISGYAEMIETGMAKEKDIKAFAGKIHHESGRLINLIGDIIKLAEINDISSKGTGDYQHVNIYDIAVNTVEALRFNASKVSVKLELKGQPCFVTGNKGMLEELIYNLCDNAIRYNKHGGSVFISVTREEGKVTLRVKDTGIGIPEEYHDRIFERFYRVDKSRSKETGGTGLGLSIVKHIAIQHKAVIKVQSNENEGTEIIVVFPG